jgi:CheY-like chemotaxis protein
MNKPDILLIEDNDQNAYLVRFLLEKAGMAVRRASTGHAGVNAARETLPDLVLLDIQLPDVDGYAVCQELRGDARFATLPIIAVTSFAMPAERERALQAGCTGYVEKPIAPLTFAEQVRSFLPRL